MLPLIDFLVYITYCHLLLLRVQFYILHFFTKKVQIIH
uniref:Uncharacterized protein n=1 Tax=Ceramothamnion japonicum TaxID=218448 RepID=A0A0E3DBB4_CERJP|nr:hypothetical protein Cjap.mt.14 [Ceramium japonicum]